MSIRDIALEAGANPGSVTYHFKSKDGLLLEIYKRHCGPMNKRRIELLVAARRVRDVQDRLEAIVRAYVQPAFSSSSDLAGGGARFTRLRAVMSAEGNAVVGRIIAEIFDDTTHAFIDAIQQSLPHLPRKTIVWRMPVPARRALLHAGQPGAGDAAVARRGRWRRHGRGDRTTGFRHRRLAAGARHRSARAVANRAAKAGARKAPGRFAITHLMRA